MLKFQIMWDKRIRRTWARTKIDSIIIRKVKKKKI